MVAGSLYAAKRRLVLGALAGFALTVAAPRAGAQAPGGFVEKADRTVSRSQWTAAEIQAFLPARGRFKFPAPYETQGIRLTNAADCKGADCVTAAGMNNHRGRDQMFIFVGLRGAGPTLFALDKASERVQKVGPLFDPSSPYAASSGEGWYFSATRPTSLYVTGASSPALLRYDVLAKTLETVFDATDEFGKGRSLGGPYSSDDDNVHSATLQEQASGANLGCLAYREDTGQFAYYPAKGKLDQCRIDRSGRWLVMQDDVDGIAGHDSRIIELETGAEKLLPGQKGGGGRTETGHGYMIAADRWNGLPGALRVWAFDGNPLEGTVVYHDAHFGSAGVGLVTHANAQPGISLDQQFACAGGAAASPSAARGNEIVCFRLDGSRERLVVAPLLTDSNAEVGRSGQPPVGMLDTTGGYFLWAGSPGGRRTDVFLVKVPAQQLTGTVIEDLPSPAVASEPAEDAAANAAATGPARSRPEITATLANPALLPTATTAQVPLTAAYNALGVPSRAAGSSYLDPSTSVKVYKLTSATFPTASPNWGHDYSEGGDEVSLPYNGNTRAVLVRQNGGSWWLIDFTPGVGVGNPRALTGTFAPLMDLTFTFSNNPATPYYAYVSNGSTIRRIDIRNMTEAPGGGWPVTGETSAMWLHQSENDGLFVWMRGANGSTVVGYEPSTATRKTYTNANLNEPRIDRAGRYVAMSMNSPLNGLVVWDWQANAVLWSHPGDPGIPFAHNASLRRRWMTVDWNMSYPPDFAVFSADVPGSAAHVPGPANGTTIHGNGNWIQHPANLNDQWALFCHYGSLRPSESYWLSPGGMVLVTPSGQKRLLGHPYNTTSDYTFFSFAKFSSDGQYVLFTSNMNGSGRSDLFLAELPGASAPDTTPPSVSLSAPAAGATVSGTLTVSANAADASGVVGVQFKLDGANLGAEDTTAPYGVAWNTTLAANGSHSLTAVARDAAGNSSVSPAVAVNVNNVAAGPVISQVASSSISTTGANITWTTNVGADTQVEYGPTAAYGSSTSLNTSMVVAHAQTLSGLLPGTLYNYRVKSRNAAGTLSVSPGFNFTTTTLLPPPVISAVSVSGVSSSGASVAWTTDVGADTQVEYGPTTAYGASTTLNTSMLVAHVQTLSALAPATLHHYRVKSRRASGALAVSGDFTFTTLAGPDLTLLTHLRFDEGTGTLAADASGHGYSGTLLNGATWTAGRAGQAAALDGVNDYVRIAHRTALNSFPLTAAVWFKTTSATGIKGLLNKYVSSSYNGYQIFLNQGQLCAWYMRNQTNNVHDGTACSLPASGFNNGLWHHAVLVVDAAGGRLYVDGVLRASRAWTGQPGAPTTNVQIRLGHYQGVSGTLAAAVDGVRIYNRALSATEVLQLYNGQP